MHLSFRPYPRVQPRPNFIIKMVGFLLKASADNFARLSVELQDREYLDDADIAVIEERLSSAKMTRSELSRLLGVSRRTVRRMDYAGTGPRPIRISPRAVRHAPAEVADFMSAAGLAAPAELTAGRDGIALPSAR